MRRALLKAIGLNSLLLIMVGCSLTPEETVLPPSNKVTADPDSRENSLINLALTTVQAESSDLSKVQLQQLRKDYVDLVPLVDELSQKSNTELAWRGVLSQEIRNRLADIEMLLAEEAQADGIPLAEGQSYYDVAIQSYKQLLVESERSPTPLDPIAKENLLYQLARAYSLQGEDQQSLVYSNRLLAQFPFSEFASELQFRQGEFFYNLGDYPRAIIAYRKVVDGAFDPYAVDGKRKVDTEDPFYAMSAYMLGWSHFKREEYRQSIDAFDLMLDASLLPDDYTQNHRPVESLGLSQQKLVQDSLDMMALMFASEGGAIAINAHYYGEDSKPYTYLVYDALAQQFLDDSRYRDSANTFLAFANRYPRHSQAIEFFIKHIDAYIIGEFPAEVLPAKQRFVEAYGISGANWQGFTAQQTVQAFPYLEQYIKELAQFEHALAQQAAQMLLELPLDDFSVENTEKRQQLDITKTKAYENTERWYREYISTFGPGEQTADMQFYLAESLFEAEQFEKAIVEYELFAYTYSESPQAPDAAYSSLLAHQMLIPDIADNGRLTPLQNSQIQFLSYFAEDRRSEDVAVTLVQGLFDAELYFDAVTWSQWLLTRTTVNETVQTARLVLSQSQFELRDYAGAQTVYEQLLANMQDSDPLRQALTEKLAATHYQQAQQALSNAPKEAVIGAKLTALEASSLRQAVDSLRLAVAAAPSSAIALNARYDAASYLLQLSDWQAAIGLMLGFEQDYPDHKLTTSIPEKLIVAYEKTQQWIPASERLIVLWQQNSNSEIGREALYLAAEYADRAGEIEIALPHYRSYAHTYPQPLALANEARFKLSEYYQQLDDEFKRNFWLQKLIDAYQQNPAEADPRARYLAAFAATEFADEEYAAFRQIKLTLPLNLSIQNKRKAMQKVLESNQKIIEYRVVEFTTKAGYRLGEAYVSLAQALYQSERPPELDALALEQYDILLEEQAYPFEEQAIEIHTVNAQRSWQGNYDEWVARSFESLATLSPAKFNKPERFSEVDYAAF